MQSWFIFLVMSCCVFPLTVPLASHSNVMVLCSQVGTAGVRQGEPSPGSTATVQVVDINDNNPTIPPMEPVVIAESKTPPLSNGTLFPLQYITFDQGPWGNHFWSTFSNHLIFFGIFIYLKHHHRRPTFGSWRWKDEVPLCNSPTGCCAWGTALSLCHCPEGVKSTSWNKLLGRQAHPMSKISWNRYLQRLSNVFCS